MFKRLLTSAFLLVGCAGVSEAQTAVTATFDDTTEINSSVQAQGGSIPCIGAYGSCQILKNLVGALNPSFEGLMTVTTWTVPADGTASPRAYSTQNFYVPTGGTAILQSRFVDNPSSGHRVYDVLTSSISNPGSVGCVDNPTGVAISPGDNAEASMTLTFAAASCPQPKQGDTHTLYTTEIPATGTPAPSGSVFTAGGGTVTYNSTTPLDGLTSLDINTMASGSGAAFNFYYDTALMDRFVNMNGTYSISFRAKKVSGTGQLIATLSRDQSLISAPAKYCLFSGAQTLTITATTTSQVFTLTCTASETSSTVPGNVQLNLASFTQSEVLIDDVLVQQTSNQDATNTTVLRDEFIDGLKTQYYLGKRGPLRYGPLLQNCMTYANWIKADGLRLNCTSNPTGDLPTSNVNLSFGDWLHVNEVLGTNAYWHLPATITTPDALKLYQFDCATTNADRAAFGHSAPYGGPGGTIADQNIAFGNEEWNDGNIGQGSHFPMPSGDAYTVYLNQDTLINAAIYADASFQSGYTELLANFQYQNVQTFMTGLNKMHLAGGAPAGVEVSPYYGFTNSTNSTDEGFFRAGLSQAYMQTHTSGSAFASALSYLRSSSTWGPSGNAAPKVYAYEIANGDDNPCNSSGDHVGWTICQNAANALIDASNLQIMNVGAVNAIVAADEYIELERAGLYGINLFALNSFGGPSQRSNPATSGTVFFQYAWGVTTDFGGANAAMDGSYTRLRPQALGTAVAHFGHVGTHMKACTTTSPTYSQAAGPSNIYQVAATSGIPYLTCARYSDNGTTRGVVFVNKSTSTTYAVTLAGTSLPTGQVSGLQFAPSSMRALNEATATLPTGNLPSQVAARTDQSTASLFNVPLLLSAPAVINVPPGVTAISYSTLSSSPASKMTIAGGIKLSGTLTVQ